jgi:HK97 family phage portal protein
MAKLSDIVVNSASVVGRAVGAFQKARDEMLRKPSFITGLAAESGWPGGNLVNVEAAQMRAARNSWLYTAINKKALDLSSAKLNIYNNPDGLEDSGNKAEGHPFYNVWRRPNPYMGRSMLLQYTEWWMDLQGEAFWFMEPEMSGVGIKGFWPIPSNKVDIEFTENGREIKRYIAKLQQWYYLDPAYVMHFKYPNPWDFFRGLPPLIAFMLTVDTDLAMKTWNGAFFGKDNVMPSAIISVGSGDPNNMFEGKDIDELENKLSNEYSAIRRKTVVTNANTMAVALLGYNAKDMDFLAGMQWNKDEILLALGIPPGMIDKNSTEANAKVAMRDFKNYMWGLKGLLADEITIQCLQPFYGETLEARFEDDRIYDREMELREAILAQHAMTREEWASKYFKIELKPSDVTMSENMRKVEIRTKESGQLSENEDNISEDSNKMMKGGEGNGRFGHGGRPGKVGESLPGDNGDNGKRDNFQFETEIIAFKTKAYNYFKSGKLSKIKFKSEFIDEKTIDSIISDLQGVEIKSDIDFIFDHWISKIKKSFADISNKESNSLKIFSFRPWSIFEKALVPIVHNALQKVLQWYLDNAHETMSEDAFIWSNAEAIFEKEVMPTLIKIAEQAGNDAFSEMGSTITLSWELTNKRAIDYAYLYEALNIRTDRKAVSDAITEWRNEGEKGGLEGLREKLSNIKTGNGLPFVSQERAELIAISEATTIYAGAKAYALEANGYPKVAFMPKAHNRCRCYIQPGLLPDGEKVVVWYTAKDELVCKQEIETPWGTVEGCRELHRTIISEGRAGEKWKE